MASSGPNYPGTGASLANSGTSENANAWANPGNVGSSSAVASITASTFDSPDISEILVASNFGFSGLPADCTILGITVEIRKRGYTSANSGKDFRVQLATGTTFASLVGSNKASASVWPQTTLTTTTYGSSSDTWSAGLTRAQVAATGFAVFVSAYANVANADIEIDWIRVTVEYRENFTLTVPFLESTPALYAPTVVNTLQSLTVPFLDHTPTIYAPTVANTQVLTVPLIDNTIAGAVRTPYDEVVLADSPVAYWRLGESAGTNLADSANANDMTLQAGTLGDASLILHDADTALLLDLTNGEYAYRNIDSGLNIGDNFTIEAWVFPVSVPDGAVIYNHGSGTNSPSLECYGGSGGIALWVGGVRVATASGSYVTAGVVCHVVATKNGSTRVIYINGVDVAATMGSNATADNSQTESRRIGAYAGGGQYFDGTIDEVAIYATALSAEQVKAHYAAGAATRGWPWTGSAEGFTTVVGAGTAGWYSSSGNPGGYVSVGHNSAFDGDGSTRLVNETTWEAMGVPYGATVLQARLIGVDRRISLSGPAATCGRIVLYDGSDSFLGTLIADGTDTAYSWAHSGPGTSQNFTDQASSAVVKISIAADAAFENPSDSSAAADIDNLWIEVSYTGGGAGAGGRVLYAPTLTQVTVETKTLTVPLVESTPDLFAPSLIYTQTLTVPLVGDDPLIYAPTVVPDQLLVVPVIDGLADLYVPTLTGKNLLTVPLIDSGSALYAPTLTGKNLLVVPLVDGVNAIYAPTLAGINLLAVPVIESTPDLFVPTLLLAPYQMVLPLIDGEAALYEPVVTKVGATPTDFIVPFIDGGADLFAPTLTLAPYPIVLPLIDAGSAIYAPVLSGTLALPLIDSVSAIYAPVVTPVNTLFVTLVDAGNAVYVVTLTGKNLLAAPLIESTPALYAPSLLLAPYPIILPLIDGGAALYDPIVTGLGTVTDFIVPFIDGGAEVYAPQVLATQQITLVLVDGGAALYAPTLTGINGLTIPFIDANAAIYAPTITLVITLPVIDAVADLYVPTVIPGPVTVVVPLVGDDPLIYAPTLTHAVWKITVPLIDGTGEVYTITVALAAVTIGGFTRSGTGAIVPNATVDLFRSSDNAFIGTTTSDIYGAYSFLVTPGVEYFLVAYELGADIYGVTERDLVGS